MSKTAELSLESLGLSQEDLASRLVNKLAENLLTSLQYDEEGGQWHGDSAFAKKLDKMVKDRLDKIVNDMAEKHVLPRVNDMVENMVLQETNRWGEKIGKSLTFREYLVQRAEAWMTEQVDYNGKPKGTDGFSWTARSTRVAHMIHQHLHYEIERAMKEAFAAVNTSVAKGLNEAVRIAINNVTSKLKVQVSTQ